MMVCDAEWLARTLDAYAPAELTPLVNLGASTEHFRTVEQPYIDRLVFGPLVKRGVKVIHADAKPAPGVDVVGDIFDAATVAALRAYAPRAIICTHMFEHVVDRQRLADSILSILSPDGLFFVTVPSSYHRHDDPIDTMFRPTPTELASMFHGQEILGTEELVGHTYWALIRKRPFILVGRHLGRILVPFLNWGKWKRSTAKLYWLFHPYKVAAIVGRKTKLAG